MQHYEALLEEKSHKLQCEPAQESYRPLSHFLGANATGCIGLLPLQPLTYLCSASPT
jgi:hypothetical protein